MALTQAAQIRYNNGYAYTATVPSAPPASTFFIGPYSYMNINCIFCLGEDGAIFSNNMCPCSYMFHRECLVKYFKFPECIYMCPLCRTCVKLTSFDKDYINRFIQTSSIAANRTAEEIVANDMRLFREDLERRQLRQRHIIKFISFFLLLGVVIAILVVAFTAATTSWRGNN